MSTIDLRQLGRVHPDPAVNAAAARAAARWAVRNDPDPAAALATILDALGLTTTHTTTGGGVASSVSGGPAFDGPDGDRFTREWAKITGAPPRTPAYPIILHALHRHGPLTSTDLATHTGIPPRALADRQVRRLREIGAITSPHTRPGVAHAWHLTPLGRRLIGATDDGREGAA